MRHFTPIMQGKTSIKKTISISLCYTVYRNLDSESEAEGLFPSKTIRVRIAQLQKGPIQLDGNWIPKDIKQP